MPPSSRHTRPGRVAAALVAGVLLLCVPPEAGSAATVGAEPPGVLVPSGRSADLAASGVIVVPGRGSDVIPAYGAIVAEGVPAFITSDCVLAITRGLLEEVLLRTEDRHLYDGLADLSGALVRLSEEQLLSAVDPTVREAARRNVAFFAVALSLLDPDYFPPESVRGLVERELALIEQGSAVTLSPIMGATPLDGVVGPGEDYREYAPRGRHAADERLGRLHRAVTWYSRMAFALPEGRVLDYGLTMQALLIARAMQSEAGDWFEAWELVYDPLRFYLGGSGDPTVEDYIEAAVEVFGDGYAADDVANQERLAAFVEVVGRTAPPHFETHELRGLRFLARPTLADTKYFARLSGSADRPLPAALDLAGLLGSHWARGALEERDAFASDVYRRGFDEFSRELETMTYGEWTQDLPWSWIYALEALASAPPAGSPAFTRSPGWAAKQTSTIAAGWALLRRDPVGLSAVAPGGAGFVEPSASPAAPMVEPCPLFYARLRELVEHLRDRLWECYLLDEDVASALAAHREFLASLETASQSARDPDAGRTVSPPVRDPAAHASAIASRLGAPRSGAAAPGDAFAARVFSDLVSGRALTVAVGRSDAVLALASDGNEGPVYGGAVFSYYEFERAGADWLTTAEWARRLESREPPERPWWIRGFIEE